MTRAERRRIMKSERKAEQYKKSGFENFLNPYNGNIFTIFPNEVEAKEQFDECIELDNPEYGGDERCALIAFMYRLKNCFEGTTDGLQDGQEYLLRFGKSSEGNAIIQFRSKVGEEWDCLLDDVWLDKKTLKKWGMSWNSCEEVVIALSVEMIKRYHTIHLNKYMLGA